MVIDSKITVKSAYPWFFFFRIARLTLAVFLPTLFIILFLYRSSYRTGIVAQLNSQIQEDLKAVKLTGDGTREGWITWCRQIHFNESRYTFYDKNEKVLCDTEDRSLIGKKISLFQENEIQANIQLKENLFLQKTVPFSALQRSMEDFDRVLFLRIVPFAFASYLLFIFLFYRNTRPLGTILSRVEKFKDDIPFHRSIQLLYRRDNWGAIEEALIKADQRFQSQIQEVKLENEKNAAILESISDDIIAIDRFETILFFNRKFENSFMKRRSGLDINRKLWHIFEDDVLKAFRSVLKSGTPVSLRRARIPSFQKADRYYDLSITPLKSANGIINGALGVLHDVTEFKLAEQMRVDFVANVSHEIRTPLTSIKGFTQILQGQTDKVDPSLHPFMDKIVANTERMISLFNDLLSLSVIESRNEIQREEVDLEEIVSITKDNIIASYPELKITLRSELEVEKIYGDYRLLEQVILNLSDNACKYAQNKVNLLISSRKNGKNVHISIKDDGPGIPREHLSRIFERFYRIDASREALRGTGLGLSIVKQVIQKHRGRIWAESEGQGTGTTFIIELPLE